MTRPYPCRNCDAYIRGLCSAKPKRRKACPMFNDYKGKRYGKDKTEREKIEGLALKFHGVKE